MARIENIGIGNISNVEQVKTSPKKAIQETFKQKLNDVEQEQIRSELTTLYDKIETQSEKMHDRLFIEDLVEYRSLVKDFLDISVNNSHVFHKENSLDRRGRHRVYSLVKKVDNELDQLTKDFLDIENNRISILGRLDDIKGILLDILT